MPSFDVVSKVNMPEVTNAVNQAKREITNRYDFRGTKTELELDTERNAILLKTSDKMRLSSMVDVLHTKLAKRGVSILALHYGKVETASGNMLKQTANLQQGLDKEKAKELIKVIKKSKIKVQAQIMDDQIRITGKKRDDLQEVIALLREEQSKLSVPLQFVNMRS